LSDIISKNKFQESSGGHNEVLQTLVDDLTEREARLESNNRKLNQKILELESKLEEARGAQNFVAPRVPGSREELELKLAEANKKVPIIWPQS
jgi:CII-binding regulator of phage lambda lysogenization HflD